MTGFVDEVPGNLDHVRVAERIAGELVDRGQVRFGVGRELRAVLEELRTGEMRDGVMAVEPRLSMPVRDFGAAPERCAAGSGACPRAVARNRPVTEPL